MPESDRLSVVIGPFHPYPTVETTTVSDSGNTLVVLMVTLFLVSAGVALTAVAVWYWRSTVPDPESLGPLHSMSTRRFVGLDEVEQRRALDAARPSLATDPLVPVERRHDMDAGDVVDTTEFPDDEVVASPIVEISEEDDEVWPGDDWSDLNALQHEDPEILIDTFDEQSDVAPVNPSRPAPIDPLIM